MYFMLVDCIKTKKDYHDTWKNNDFIALNKWTFWQQDMKSPTDRTSCRGFSIKKLSRKKKLQENTCDKFSS